MKYRDPLGPEVDDEEFEEALRAVAGTLTPEEGERRIQEIYRWREEGSRPMHMITPSRAWDDPDWALLTQERIAAVTREIFGEPVSEINQQNVETHESGRE